MKTYYMVQFKNKKTNRWKNLTGAYDENEIKIVLGNYKAFYPTYELRKKEIKIK